VGGGELITYENGQLIVDLNQVPEGWDMTIHVDGRGTMDVPNIEVAYKSNVSLMRHGNWAKLIDKKLASFPGMRKPNDGVA